MVHPCHFWSNERDLHGDLRWGNNYRLTGSENSPINGVFVRDSLFHEIKNFLIDVENHEPMLNKVTRVKELLNKIVKEELIT